MLSKSFARIALLLTVLFILFSNVKGRALERIMGDFINLIPWLIVAGMLTLVGALFKLLAPHIIKLKREQKHELLKSFVFFIFYCFLLMVFINEIAKYPIEKIHFLKYGLVGFFCFFSLQCSSFFRTSALTFCIGSSIGIADECLQYFIPNRYFDLWDILYNVLGTLGGLSLALIAEYSFWRVTQMSKL